MFCSPEYRMTRLNGMPSQMLVMITDVSAMSGEVSQLTDPKPSEFSRKLKIPLSLFIIQAHVDAETIRGNSHGTRNIARNVFESGKFLWKNTASARPIVYWKTSDTITKSAVFPAASKNVGLRRM